MTMIQGQWIDTEGFAAEHPLSKAIELVLAATLLFAPLAFGTTEPWSEQVVIFLAGLLLVLFLLKYTFCSDTKVVWHWAYVPVFLWILLVTLQLLPLPRHVVGLLSPQTLATKTELLSGLSPEGFEPGTMKISFYPHATYHDLRLVFAVVAVFFVTFNYFRSIRSIKRLLGFVAIVGGGVAFLTIAQFVTQTDKIYWVFPIVHDLAGAGPFVNHSNFAQFMNLSTGAAIGLLLVHIYEFLGHREIESNELMDFLGSREARPIWALLVVVVLGVGAIFVSLSRGGIVSFLLAVGFTTCMMSLGGSQKGRAKVIALVVLVAFACILYIGFDAVYDRMATLSDLEKAQSGRVQILQDIFVAWTRFPWFGTGLGTHSVVYPMFDSSINSSLASHAENEYAQAIEETGLIGLGLLVLFGACVCRAFIHNVRQKDALVQAGSYGLGFGLLAILLHSFTDFGQHLPPNAFLSAVFCALLLSLAKSDGSIERGVNASTGSHMTRLALGVAAVLVVGSVWAWMVFQADRARIASGHWDSVSRVEKQLQGINWQGTDEEYIELLTNAQAATQALPDNAKLRYWLNVYRWHSISRIVDPNTGHVLLLPDTIKFTKQIVEDLKQACLLCPTFGPAYSVLGELQVKVLGDPNGVDNIRTGYKLAPCDATACFTAGSLDVEAGLGQQAFEKLSRAIDLDPNYLDEAVGLCLNKLNDPNLALSLAQGNLWRLSGVANQLAVWDPNDNTVYQSALSQMRAELESLSQQPGATADVFASLARICSKGNEIDAAIKYYQKALVLDYGRSHWHYLLARLYARQDKLSDALHEARICLRLDKTFTEAQHLIDEIKAKGLDGEL